jgi:pSer/pThr/pTyr-binding forkhead associated (FHA) protein
VARGKGGVPVERPAQAGAARAVAPARDAAAAGGAAQPASATLIGVTGPLTGQRIALAGALTIGKGPDNAVVVPGDGAVSTRHCQIGIERGQVVLRDLGSTNGTWVNGRRIAEPVQLRDGDLVRLGAETQFKLRVG